MGVQQRRERERMARKKAVLDAARALVRERGMNGTTTRQIAERCELSEATLFFYFGSKDEILTSLLFEGIDFMSRGLDAIAASDASPLGKLGRLWRFFAELREEHPEYFYVFTYLAHPQATASVTDDVRAEIARRSGDNLRRFAELVRGVVAPRDARIAADLIWAAFAGLIVLRDSRKNLGAKPHPTEPDLRRGFDLLLGGIASGAGGTRGGPP